MRGFLTPAVRTLQSDIQTRFQSFSRGRRTKLAKGASTTLLKADQWARGGSAAADVAAALDKAVAGVKTK
jgi:hypothetical protein